MGKAAAGGGGNAAHFFGHGPRLISQLKHQGQDQGN